jgi:hypothetical protein
MGTLTDDLKKNLLHDTQKLLYGLAENVGPRLSSASDTVAALLRNSLDGVSAADFTKAQAHIETTLAEALDTLTEILQLAAALKRGELPR